MQTLMISKINNIEVIQIGDTSLSISNKSIESNKVSSEKNKKNTSKSVDIGKGSSKYSFKIHVLNNKDYNDLYDILVNVRYCDVQDKYKGVLKVYINNINIVNSDKHSNITVFSIDCTVQVVNNKTIINTKVELKESASIIKDDILKDIDSSIKIIEDDIKAKSLSKDWPYASNGILNYYDDFKNFVSDNLSKVIMAEYYIYNTYDNLEFKVNQGLELTKVFLNIRKKPREIFNFIKKNLLEAGVIKEDNPIVYPIIKGKIIKNKYEGINIYDKRFYDKQIIFCKVLNKIKLYNMIKSITNDTLKKRKDIVGRLDMITSLLNYINDEKYQNQNLLNYLRDIINNNKYINTINVDIVNPKPLISIVYNYYGHLNYYNDILELNNIYMTEAFTGKLELFRDDINNK